MATIERFEDIQAWQRARQLVSDLYELTHTGAFSRDFALMDQIRRAGISVMSNIAEGFERGGTAEFRNFLSIARGSVGEVRAQLYVALDQQYIDENRFEQLRRETVEIARTLSGLINYLNRTDLKGHKYGTHRDTNSP